MEGEFTLKNHLRNYLQCPKGEIIVLAMVVTMEIVGKTDARECEGKQTWYLI